MGFVNLVMGIVAAVLIATGIKKDEPTPPTEKKPKVEIIEEKKIIEPTFDFDELIKRADKLLSIPYEEPKKITPKGLSELNYEKYKDIRFNPDKTIWRAEGNPFQLQFLHPGYIYNHDVIIYELINKKYKIIPYDNAMFDFSQVTFKEKLPSTLGFSGFKVHYPINTEEHTDEFVVFQGATYFRSVSAKQLYGLSARGLAINTLMHYPEDFPIFKEFWVEKPDKGDKYIRVYALMDGNSAVGAFRFEFYPGQTTVTHVKARITLRKEVDRLGLAPLTSMYWYGENSETPHFSNYPEIHDSDGLLVHCNENEWIWRPMSNPKKSMINAFAAEKIHGFGLLQRDRDFSSYEDPEMRYHIRPGAWIEPIGDWGKGSVQTYRNPTNKDSDDNIGAFWVPEITPEVGKPFEIEYKIHWVHENPKSLKLALNTATKVKPNPQEPTTKTFQIDFRGGSLDLEKPIEDINGAVSASENVEVQDIQVIKIEESKKWRLSFKIKTSTVGKPVELKAFLKEKDSPVTEIWTYTAEF